MTNFKSVLFYALILVGLVFIGTLFLSDVIFDDLTKTNSVKPLLIVVPVMGGLGWYLYNSLSKKK